MKINGFDFEDKISIGQCVRVLSSGGRLGDVTKKRGNSYTVFLFPRFIGDTDTLTVTVKRSEIEVA